MNAKQKIDLTSGAVFRIHHMIHIIGRFSFIQRWYIIFQGGGNMGAEKEVGSQGAGYETMFVMLAYLAVLITGITCIYTLM